MPNNIIMADAKNGSGVKTASGSFKPGGNAYHTFTHNLGTNKIFGMIWMQPNDDNEIVTNTGYQLIFSTFITEQKMNELYSGTTLVSNYTSSETKTAAYPANGYMIGGGRRLMSKWRNSAAGWDVAGVSDWKAVAVDDNTINLTYVGVSGPYFDINTTYYWQCWALE